MDYDAAKPDELAGSLVYSIKDMLKKGQQVDDQGNRGYFYWQNLYGAP
jgi:hypothetical protein